MGHYHNMLYAWNQCLSPCVSLLRFFLEWGITKSRAALLRNQQKARSRVVHSAILFQGSNISGHYSLCREQFSISRRLPLSYPNRSFYLIPFTLFKLRYVAQHCSMLCTVALYCTMLHNLA